MRQQPASSQASIKEALASSNRSGFGAATAEPGLELPRDMNRIFGLSAYGAMMIVAVLVMFREFFFGSMTLIAGDLGDSRLVIYLLEHWRNAFMGEVPWRSPGFFFPAKGVLGHAEALFLFSVPFALLRAAGTDTYLALEWTLVLMRLIGMIGLALVLKRVLGFSHPLSAFGAGLYGVLSAIYLKVGHTQMLAVDLLPLLIVLLHEWLGDAPRTGARQWISGVLLALLIPLGFFTSYNVAWMVAFYVLITLAAALLSADFRRIVGKVPALVRARTARIATLGVVFVLAWVPFVATYLPVHGKFGKRSYWEVTHYLPHWLDMINSGQGNWVWGGLLSKIFDWQSPRAWHEVRTGLTPVLLASFLFTFGWAVARLWRSNRHHRKADAECQLAAILGTGVILTWLISTSFGEVSLWLLVYQFVPGAGAIRAVGRIQLILGIPALVVALMGLKWSVERLQVSASPRWRSLGTWLVVPALCLFLFVEQLNAGPTHYLNRREDIQYLAAIGPPPNDCKLFYIEAPVPGLRPNYAYQLDAMLISQRYGLPTVNGYSGQFPKKYSDAIFTLRSPDYEQGIRDWLALKRIDQGVCRLALSSGTWTAVGSSSATSREESNY
jgi:hypothetical protein